MLIGLHYRYSPKRINNSLVFRMKPECNSLLHPQLHWGHQWKKARPLPTWKAISSTQDNSHFKHFHIDRSLVQTFCALQRKIHSNGLKPSRDQCRKYRTKPIVYVFCKSKSTQGTGWRRGNKTNLTLWRKIMHSLCLQTAILFHKSLPTLPCICVGFELHFACLNCTRGKFHLILWSLFPTAPRLCQR